MNPCNPIKFSNPYDFVQLEQCKGESNATDESENTPLHLAARDGNLSAARFLIENGTDIHVKNAQDKTALHLASKNGHLEVAAYLIENGADMDTIDEKESFTYFAIQNKNVKMVKLLIEYGVKSDTRNGVGDTFLLHALFYGNFEIVELLIGMGAEINAENNHDGTTPLHQAIYSNDLKSANLLLKNGADIQAKNCYQSTLLHATAGKTSITLLNFFIKKGLEIEAKNKGGETPFHIALKNHSLRAAKLLIENGARIDTRDRHGNTALHSAVREALSYECLKTIQFLIKNGADVHAEDAQGRTALEYTINHYAINANSYIKAKSFILAACLKHLQMEKPACLFENPMLSKFWEGCQKEAQALHRINPLLIEILLESDEKRLAKLSLNRSMMDAALKQDFIKNYPVCGPLIREKLKKRRCINFIFSKLNENKMLPWTLKNHLEFTTENPSTYSEDALELSIPNEIFEKILNFLSTEFLESIITTAKHAS